MGSNRKKTDYKNELDDAAFQMFSELRKCRKQIADDEALPAFAVFTDAELAEMTTLAQFNLEALQTIKGIGPKKTEKFGRRLLDLYVKTTENETSREPDGKNS